MKATIQATGSGGLKRRGVEQPTPGLSLFRRGHGDHGPAVGGAKRIHKWFSAPFCALLLLALSRGTGQAQNDASDNLSNAVVEAASAAMSNAIVQMTEAAMTNAAASNETAQAEDAATGTNDLSETNFPTPPNSLAPSPGESRRHWMMRQRAGTAGTNQPRTARDITQTKTFPGSEYEPVKPDFSGFKLITERNIFDPNRVPHRPGAPPPVQKTIDSFALVGLMRYDKGTFAFFDGSSADYRKAVKLDDSIAGYKVTNINASTITLKAGTNQVELRVGMQLKRTEGGDWIASAQSEAYAASTTSSGETHAGSAPSGSDSDVIERLRKRREQE